MSKRNIYLAIGVIVLIILFFFVILPSDNNTASDIPAFAVTTPPEVIEAEANRMVRVDFSDISSIYKFSAEINRSWEVEYVPSTQAINIYDPTAGEGSDLDNSQIFIKYFEANSFLTLSTVDFIDWNETTIHGRDAVKYEIEKKAGVPDFPNQPSWRSSRHKLVDIRLSTSNPSLFYVYSYTPDLDEGVFEKFIDSLEFIEN